MALPSIMRKLFRNDGYGPLLKSEIIPFASDLASDAADMVASTEWARDLAVAPVYVDPAGSDSNDGLSASAPVQTFSRALAIGSVIAHSGGSDCFIVAAAGTYAGNIDVGWMRLHVRCSGAITINGDITLNNQANLIFETSGAITVNGNVVLTKQNVLSCTNASSWTQTGGISVSNSSLFFLPDSCTASVTRNSSIVVSVLGSSICHFGTLTVTSNGGSQCIVITQNAQITVSGNLTVNATGITSHAINLISASYLQVTGNMYVSTPNIASGQYSVDISNNSTLFISGSATVDEGPSAGFLVDNNSTLRIVEDLTITNSSNNATPLYISSRSFANISKKIKITASGAVYRCVLVNNGSGLFNGNPNSLLETNNTSSSGVNFMIECAVNSWCHIRSLTLNGRANSASICIDKLAYLNISSAGTVSGTVTVGKRYFVGSLSFLQVNGAGANRIPGAQAGTVSTANFALYG